jgi:hypothetical protein
MVIKWAERVLRGILKPDAAETIYGDLLEEYRAYVLPNRGRARADFWLVRQVAGYLLRGGDSRLRNGLLTGLALSALVMIYSLMRFAGRADAHDVKHVLFACSIMIFYTYAAIRRTHPVTDADELVLRLGARWGLAIGCVWSAPLVFLNLAPRILGGLSLLLIPTGVVLPFIAGAHAGIKTDRVRTGFRVGFWSSLVSGLVLFFVLTTSGYILGLVPGFPGAEIPKTPVYTAAEYERVNVMDALGGAMAFLFMICPLSGLVGGTFGGWAGIRLARTGGPPETHTQTPSI